MIEVRVDPAQAGVRLDVFVGMLAGVGSRTRGAALIDDGRVTVGGLACARSYRVKAGDIVRVEALPLLAVAGESAPVAENIPVRVVYEDRWLLVVDKPAGLVVHPAKGHMSGTLVNALLGRGIAGGESARPGIVHRLDKDTSGLMLVTKDAATHRALSELIRCHRVRRIYLALVHGRPAPSGTIEAPIGRDARERKSMTVGGLAARAAVTHFTIVENLGDYSLVEVRLETGRTHQIRVHFRAIGHPVCGDPVYGRTDSLRIGRQFLHSHALGLTHPATGRHLELRSDLPEDLAHVLSRLRRGPC